MEGSELFRHAENWLTNNPGKTLRDYRVETGYDGPALKPRQRKGQPIRVSYKGKSSEAQTRRAATEKPKTPEEAAAVRQVKRQAKAQSQSTLHQHAAPGRPSIAEHDVRLASGGTNEFMSISDPNFKDFKDTLEQKTSRMYGNRYVVDIDEISGYPRVVDSRFHNKFEPVSKQPGLTIEPGMDIDSSLAKLKPRMSLKGFNGGIRFSGTSFRGMMPAAVEFIPMIDEITGGHLDRAIGTGINAIRGAIGFSPNPIRK
tara:strand:- start:41 stop:811 length:771 start_codon:yes stop_codon:yes gene_type:complete